MFLKNTGEMRFISLRRKRDKNPQQNKHTHTHT
jgi:hypothetical protein